MRRRWLAFLLGLTLAFLFSSVAEAQSPADSVLLRQADSLLAQLDRIRAKLGDTTTLTIWDLDLVAPDEATNSVKAYAGMITAGLVLNTVFKIDRDPCPSGKRVCFTTNYDDKWLAADKWNHYNVSFFLAGNARRLGVPEGWAFGLTCGLAGAGLELTQGYVSLKDIGADCLGAASGILAGRLADKASDFLFRRHHR